MKVFKFGGASIKDVDHIKHVSEIISVYSEESPLLVVISAMGKTTNALEKVAEIYYEGNLDKALALFQDIKKEHIDVAKYLLVTHFNQCLSDLVDLFTEVEWLLHDKPIRSYDYYYDQIVCMGELLSTTIISAYLSEVRVSNKWIDARDVIKTDNNFRDAIINWASTNQKVQEQVKPFIEANHIVITQGFIGSTDDNESVTLGREGSDFSAAIFSNLLDAQDVTIWKDVEGVMNADPKKYADAVYLAQLSYAEVIEMAYYGAQVIHPKTIKPLQNKSIPLYVKCFLDTGLPGTLITQEQVKNLPPIIISKDNQTVIKLRTLDYSFITGHPMSIVQEQLELFKIKPNIIQAEAISLELCLDDNKSEKIDLLAEQLSVYFDVHIERNLRMITLRHYDESALDKYIRKESILLLQRTSTTVQAVVR